MRFFVYAKAWFKGENEYFGTLWRSISAQNWRSAVRVWFLKEKITGQVKIHSFRMDLLKLIRGSSPRGGTDWRKPPTHDVGRFLFMLRFDSRKKWMLWDHLQSRLHSKWVFRGSSPFRCLLQQGIECTLSMPSTERFFLTYRGVESRRDHSWDKLMISSSGFYFLHPRKQNSLGQRRHD